MKKNVVIIIQTILMGLFLIFAFIQKLEADKQTEIAKANLMEAQRQEKLAKEATAIAEVQRKAAEAARIEAEAAKEDLIKCGK